MLQTLTTWVNKVLKDTDAESVVDLRKCVGDGVTLVKLAEKTCKCMYKKLLHIYAELSLHF